MADEVIGSVAVQITGDTSGLGPSFTAAQQQASQAGASIAGSFNAGAAGANQITAAIERLTVALREESAAATLADQRNAALGRTVQQFGQHSQNSGFSARYLFLGIKDLAEGRSTFALAELSNQLIRFGPAALAGAGAVGILAAAFYGPIYAAKQLQAEIDKTGKEIDASFDSAETSIEHVRVALQSLQFGAAAGKALEGFYTKESAARDLDKVHALGIEVDGIVKRASSFHLADVVPFLGSKLRSDESKQIVDKQAEQVKLIASAGVKSEEEKLKTAEEARLRAELQGSIGAINATGQEKDSIRRAEADLKAAQARITAAHEVRQAQIDGIQDAGDRDIASARERTRVAQEEAAAKVAAQGLITAATITGINARAAAEKQGKAAPEQQKIEATRGVDLAAARFEGLEKQKDATRAAYAVEAKEAEASANAQRGWAERLTRDIVQAYDARIQKARRTFEIENTPGAVATLTGQRVGEIRAQNAGDLEALRIAGQKAQIEVTYGAQKTHTLAQEVAFRQALLRLQDQEYSAKARGLQAELAQARDDEQSVLHTEKQIAASARVAEIEGRIAILTQEQANARAAGAAQSGRLGAGARIGADVESAKAQLGPAIGSAVAKGVFDGGKGIGADIKNALKGIGEQLLGHVIDQLVVTLIANTIATNANTLWLAVGGFLGLFADGGSPPVGVPSIVGERGPELFVPHQAGSIIPNHKLKGYADGAAISSVMSDNSFSGGHTFNFALNGVNNGHQVVDHVMRELPGRLKTKTSQFSRYSR